MAEGYQNNVSRTVGLIVRTLKPGTNTVEGTLPSACIILWNNSNLTIANSAGNGPANVVVGSVPSDGSLSVDSSGTWTVINPYTWNMRAWFLLDTSQVN